MSARKAIGPITHSLSKEHKASAGSNRDPDGAYATTALKLAKLGLAPIPVNEKKPAIRNWSSGKWFIKESEIRKLQQTHADSNIGLVTGSPSRIFVVDIDRKTTTGSRLSDEEFRQLAAQMLARFGDTPVIVDTPSGGCHLVYKYNNERSANLRKYGLAVDLLGPGRMVVCPPSSRSEIGEYRFRLGGFEKYAELPTIKPSTLNDLKHPPTSRCVEPIKRGTVSVGERNDQMFRYGMGQVSASETSEELIDVLETWIEDNCEILPTHRISRAEIYQTARSLWSYRTNHTLRLVGGPAYLQIDESGLLAFDGDADAFMLWSKLKICHGVRQEPFAISVPHMVEHQVIPNWARYRYRKAIKSLLGLNLLTRTYEGGRGPGDPHKYRLLGHFGKGAKNGNNITNIVLGHKSPSQR
jgi:hypothetical protein